MKTSRFIQPARRKGPAAPSIFQRSKSRDEDNIASEVPTTESSTTLEEDLNQNNNNSNNNNDDDARSASENQQQQQQQKQQQQQTGVPPTTTAPHPAVVEDHSSPDTSKDSSNETSIEEVIIGLDQSYKDSRWNSANSITGSVLSLGGSEPDDHDDNVSACGSVHSVQSMTGTWEVRRSKKGSGDSAHQHSLESGRGSKNNNIVNDNNDIINNCDDDCSGIMEVYNDDWDHDSSSNAVAVEDAATKQGSLLQPLLTSASTSPTSVDGLDDDHFPEVDRPKFFRMLNLSGPSAFSSVVSAKQEPQPEPLSNNNKNSKQGNSSSSNYYYWKHAAFWLAVLVGWLYLAAGLRCVRDGGMMMTNAAQQQPTEEQPPIMIEIAPNLLALGLNHEL